MSGRKEAPSLSQEDSFQANKVSGVRSPAMQFEVSSRNKIIINFVHYKKVVSEEQKAKEIEQPESLASETNQEKTSETPKEKPKKGFFGRFFSGKKKPKKKESAKDTKEPEPRRFENVRVINSQTEKEKLFADFHSTMYNTYIQKIMRVINKHENLKIASEISNMNNFLSNTVSNKELKKFLEIDTNKQSKTNGDKQKKDGIIKEESFEKLTSSELENWYFDLESLAKIVDCLN